jgi:hypothetical protein
MLGPGVIILGTPVALVASISAVRGARDRPLAILALLLSSLELIGLLSLAYMVFLR